MTSPRPGGLVALTAFFAFGAVMSLLTALALLQYDGPLEPMWRLNPEAHAAFLRMGTWAVALMIVVCCACLASAIGLWNAKVWGFRLAFGVLTVNLLGDLTNALLRQDLRTLIGIPIGVGLLWYLRQLHRRGEFVRVSH